MSRNMCKVHRKLRNAKNVVAIIFTWQSKSLYSHLCEGEVNGKLINLTGVFYKVESSPLSKKGVMV